MRLGQTLSAIVVVASLVIGCGGDDLPFPDRLDKVPETDNQTAVAESRLPLPVAVIVRASDGRVLPRVKVRWRIDPGAGSLSDSVTLSDALGRAQVDYTLGRAVGPYTVRAVLVPNASRIAVFGATATPAPTLTSVSPSQFTGGDLVTVQGTGLASTALFEVNGAPARVASGTSTSLAAVIPVCLAPGQATLRARVNGGYTNVINGTYVATSAPVRMGVGDYASIDPVQLAGCATFPSADDSGAEYLIVTQAASGTPGVSAAYRLVGDSAVQVTVAPPTAEEAQTAAAAFHDFLRGREAELSRLSRRTPVQGTAPAAAATVAAIRVGDTRSFRVCNKFNCVLLADFSKIQARAKFVGTRVAIFQDLEAPANGFSDEEFAATGLMFDEVLYDVNTRAFGAESDIDENGLVFILLTPVVNQLTSRDQCTAAVVTGFFFAIDVDPEFAADQRANQAEVFYSLVPDPQGAVTCTLAKDRIRQVVPTTFIHEFQHMISFNQHVLLRRGPSEDLWLNEALSHLAEELGAVRLRAATPGPRGDTLFSEFVISNVFNGYQYLKAPGSYFTLFGSGAGSLAERGSAWLFLRWLVDRFGTDLTRRLEETPRVGQENVAGAVGEPISRLLAQWSLANYVSDLPGFTAPPRLRYESWRFRTTYASLNQQQPQRYDRPFPLVPQVVSGGTFAASGTLRSGSGDYFRAVQSAGQRGFTLRLTDPFGDPVPESAVARINVIRIR